MARKSLTAILLPGDPVAPLEAAPKQYVDAIAGGQSLPVGSIIMWGGDASNVPTGWLLCDGSVFDETTYPALFSLLSTGFGGTVTDPLLPDMRDRFVVGAGSLYARNAKGGSSFLSQHEHSITHNHNINAPIVSTGPQSANHQHGMPHTHQVTGNTGPDTVTAHGHATAGFGGRPGSTGAFTVNTASPSNTDTGSVSVGHDHNIDIPGFVSGGSLTSDTGTAGTGGTNENRPPYIGIFYIIKAA